MNLKPVLIAPFATGLDTDRQPWLAPPDSFREAINVHIHHGFLQKRSGYNIFGTLSNATRVMGIQRFINSDGSKATLAFDLTRAYLYDAVGFVFTQLDLVDIFDSGEYDYIWGVNWQSSNVVNRLYFTNGKAFNGTTLNGIRYFVQATPTVTVSYVPTISATGPVKLYGAKLIFTLGQRLIALHTFENDTISTTTHPQRARWCGKQKSDEATGWIDDVPGAGDYADAATGDHIISAQALQNQIIVFFTNSVWALLATSDPHKAFRWVKLNNYRACDGKMASVAYDRYVIALGIRGITATDGTETQRIDNRIQDFTTNVINFGQFQKVFCQRDYENTRWLTLYSGEENADNNSALVYDDDSKAYTTYDIALNCLGYGNTTRDYALSDFTVANNLDFDLQEVGEDTIQDWYFDDGEDILLGGDISGNIYQMGLTGADAGETIFSSIITASWNPFQQEGIESQLSYIDFYVNTDKETVAVIDFYKNDEVYSYASQQIKFLPNLNFLADIIQIDKTNPCLVNAPNHGRVTGDRIYTYGIKGMTILNSGNGYSVTVVDENFFTLDGIDATAYDAYTGSGAVYMKEFYQTKAWVRAYGGGIGYLHNIKITFGGSNEPFTLLGYKPYFKPRGSRTIN